MRGWAEYARRNPGDLVITILERSPSEVTKELRRRNDMIKEMERFREAHPTCYLTGTSPVQIHHIESLSTRPDLYKDWDNFIALCPNVHRYLAHMGNWCHYYRNIKELCDHIREHGDLVVTTPHKMKRVLGVEIPWRKHLPELPELLA